MALATVASHLNHQESGLDCVKRLEAAIILSLVNCPILNSLTLIVSQSTGKLSFIMVIFSGLILTLNVGLTVCHVTGQLGLHITYVFVLSFYS